MNLSPLAVAIVVSLVYDSSISQRHVGTALPRDCADLYTYYNSRMSGVYTITLSTGENISVNCDMGEHGSFGGGWTVFQKRHSAALDFSTPNWAQYEAGFGDVSSDFWLGNKYLNLLTNIPGRAMTLHVDLWDCTGDQAYEEYSNFMIDNATAFYALHVIDGSAVGNANDAITVRKACTVNNVNGARFYSPEQSVPDVPCTTLYKAGWWYNQCTQGNLNGQYQSNCGSSNTGFAWIPWGKGNSLQGSEMKIRCASWNGTHCSEVIPFCEASNPCKNGGVCIGTDINHYYCACINFTGKNCEQEPACLANPCENQGMCFDLLNGSYVCECIYPFNGKNCSTLIDYCQRQQCKNGATCQCNYQKFTYDCLCAGGWTGQYCDNELVDYCGSTPCLNGGTCSNDYVHDTYNCLCSGHYSGVRCETGLLCTSNPCQNGGSCIENGNSISCTCPTEFTGTFCEKGLDYCTNSHCQNGATCVSNINTGTYECSCAVQFTGQYCQTALSCATANVCKNGGTCSDIVKGGVALSECTCPVGYHGADCSIKPACLANPCKNQGTCFDLSDGDYVCECIYPFNGKDCSTLIDYCQLQQCKNGAICKSNYQTFTYDCSCAVGWTGQYCDIGTCNNPAFSCMNGGTCAHLGIGLNDLQCSCPDEYTGLRCENPKPKRCSSSPCLNDGTCEEDYPNNGFKCTCSDGFTGPTCNVVQGEFYIVPDGSMPYLLIQSENYPNKYPNNETSTWTLNATAGEHIWLAIEALNIEDSPNCACDSLVIIDGSNTETFCGSTAPATYVSQTNSLSVTFKTDTSWQDTGFQAAFHTVGNNCSFGANVALSCANGGSCVPGNNLASAICVCTNSFTGPTCSTAKPFCGASNPCQNGGVCTGTDINNYSCACINDFTGKNCEQAPRRDCADLYTYYNNRTSGVYGIKLSTAEVISVYCDMGEHGNYGGGWTLLQKRHSATLDFSTPNWAQYEAGFGDVSSDFWLGNKYLNLLTNVPGRAMKLHVDLWDCTGDQAFEEYSNFVIDNATAFYALHVIDGSAIGNANDGITVPKAVYNVNGARFYSPEQNVSPVPCTLFYKAGWWYNQCTQGNLNGKYQSNCAISNTGFTWIPWDKGNTLQGSEMKIRPASYGGQGR